MAHSERNNGFVEYAYATFNTQLNGRSSTGTITIPDNTATLHVIGNQAFSSRTKHIALRFFYVRELVNDGAITIHYIPTENQLADIGTKFLNKQRLRFLINIIKNFGN